MTNLAGGRGAGRSLASACGPAHRVWGSLCHRGGTRKEAPTTLSAAPWSAVPTWVELARSGGVLLVLPALELSEEAGRAEDLGAAQHDVEPASVRCVESIDHGGLGTAQLKTRGRLGLSIFCGLPILWLSRRLGPRRALRPKNRYSPVRNRVPSHPRCLACWGARPTGPRHIQLA